MSKWDRRMLGLVNLIATWSKDPSTGVGDVIVDAKNRVVSLGYNGFPRAPCARCAAKLIQAGIARVVAQMPAEGFGERWADDMRSASAMFLEAGVGFEYLENR